MPYRSSHYLLPTQLHFDDSDLDAGSLYKKMLMIFLRQLVLKVEMIHCRACICSEFIKLTCNIAMTFFVFRHQRFAGAIVTETTGGIR
jgi:hypothetical protein